MPGVKPTRMFPGSQEMRLPKMMRISLLAWPGTCRRTLVAKSTAFCKEGSPVGTYFLSFSIASKCFWRFPDSGETISALLFLVTIRPNWLIGFWSKYSWRKACNKVQKINFVSSKWSSAFQNNINSFYSFKYRANINRKEPRVVWVSKTVSMAWDPDHPWRRTGR